MKSTPAVFGFVAFLAACGGAEPAATTPTNAPMEPQNPTATPAVETSNPAVKATPEPVAAVEEPKAPAAIVKPKSKWTTNGKSLSEIDGMTLVQTAEKAGYAKNASVGQGKGGAYESVNFPLEKGKMKGELTLVRPTATPTASTSPLLSPAELVNAVNKDTTAFIYDADADVFLKLEITEGGKAADAKKILSTMTKQAK